MKFVILYSNKSSKTGKELLTKFKTVSQKAFRKRSNKLFKADLVLRWGSTENFPNLRSKIELNDLEAVKKASNKLLMMKTLKENNIPTPEICFDMNNESMINSLRDENGGFYVRGQNQEIRYDDEVRSTDLYVSKPIENKRREYRVHVFNGEIVGIYEKVPREENVQLFKSHNCDFQSRNPENCRVSKEDQEMCIKAVNSLGLLFGGLDLCRTSDRKCYVLEVNSSPALNTPNVDRYFNLIMRYYEEKSSLQDSLS